MQSPVLLLAFAGGGTVWALHLLAGYFLVSLGCPRAWPALTGMLGAVTAACVVLGLGMAVVARREQRRIVRTADDGDAAHMLLGISILLASLFVVMVIMSGLAVVALPPCQAAIGGAR